MQIYYNNMELHKMEINGLFYVDDVNENNNDIIEQLDKLKWSPLSNSINSRVVQHYGYKYNYATYKINEKCDDLPEFLNIFKNKLTDICIKLNIIDTSYNFNQCIVNNYDVGQGISPHIDVKSYGDVIGCFTLGSGAIMKFTNKDETFEIYAKPNSLYIMSGDARYKWCHSMPIKKYDIVNGDKITRKRRISITFRNVPPNYL